MGVHFCVWCVCVDVFDYIYGTSPSHSIFIYFKAGILCAL